MPQKCQLLWQQGGHPHDALSLSWSPWRLPAGCASGWLFHEGESLPEDHDSPHVFIKTYQNSEEFKRLYIFYLFIYFNHRGIYVKVNATCLWGTAWRPAAVFRRSWSWISATERLSRKWECFQFLQVPCIKESFDCTSVWLVVFFK